MTSGFGNVEVIGDPDKEEQSGGDKHLIGKGSIRMGETRREEGKSCIVML